MASVLIATGESSGPNKEYESAQRRRRKKKEDTEEEEERRELIIFLTVETVLQQPSSYRLSLLQPDWHDAGATQNSPVPVNMLAF